MWNLGAFMRVLAYAYALIFAAGLGPFMSWLGVVSGLWWGIWDRLFNDLATGVLWSYGSLISIEILVRTHMMAQPVINAWPSAVPALRFSATIFGFIGIVAATLMWATQQPYGATNPVAYWSALAFCSIALGLLLWAVTIESAGKEEVDAFLKGSST